MVRPQRGRGGRSGVFRCVVASPVLATIGLVAVWGLALQSATAPAVKPALLPATGSTGFNPPDALSMEEQSTLQEWAKMPVNKMKPSPPLQRAHQSATLPQSLGPPSPPADSGSVDGLGAFRLGSALQAAELEPSDMHVVFSTDCSEYQDWQSEVVFHSALLVQQPGRIVRIASGCSDTELANLRARYARLFPARFSVHGTPQFNRDEKTGKTYHFYNKPRGLLHWLNHASPPLHKDAIVALIDPDFAFLRPLTSDLKQEQLLWSREWSAGEIPKRVTEGHPVGQQYGLGAKWTEFRREYICGAGSPCATTSRSDAMKYFPVGPPYIMHQNDWRKVAVSWVEFVPKVYEEYPYLLAEMYAYCMAAAHHRLRHVKLDHYMLSLPGAGGEGWRFIEPMRMDEVCQPGMPRDWWTRPLPVFLHYCQNYRVGEWMFPKRKIPRSIMRDCDQPLLEEPPRNVTNLRFRLMPPKTRTGTPRREEINERVAKFSAFALCTGIKMVNHAARQSRAGSCDRVPAATVRMSLANFP